MIDKELLEILACPETKKNLELVDGGIIDKLNAAILRGEVFTKDKRKVSERIEGGLFRQGDAKYLYPIRENIPILLVEELISLENI